MPVYKSDIQFLKSRKIVFGQIQPVFGIADSISARNGYTISKVFSVFDF
ncbi:hypothetical protein P872_18825 [Rhodonellum psychrophilum GCM71 = DSM 17998]|uniref:Uncharacterized protein n=2 Tax=Rhodonellum TaxID=336827 RepID=U5BWI4_9BACT|nr:MULTISPECIES: hypothetical protein [Rhodonellum]ERM82238.1 hypothetical protein P872_18825 [Rhodonellum psychrophilum GCM71 = DSM 17998]SDZ25978.1 hypothetical protein SAMN05444412_108170 [Rhodonellum ikkaensis]